MVKQKSRIGRKLWQLVICLTLAKIGSISPLGAQWFSPSPQVDTTNVSLFIDTNSVKDPVYQGPVFVDHARVVGGVVWLDGSAHIAHASGSISSRGPRA